VTSRVGTRIVVIVVVGVTLAAPSGWAQSQPEPQVEVATTVAFTEGPTAAADGSVYFTDIITQRILKLGADGVLSVFRERSNAANGLLIDPQGRLIACEGAEFSRPGVTVKASRA
jgi:gluconolactonase